MSDWGDRIKLAIKMGDGLTQAGLARACKVSPPSVFEWVNDVTKMIDGHNLVRAAKYLGTTPEWIITGKPNARSPAPPSQSARLDVETMAESLTLLNEISELRGWARPANVPPMALAVVYELLLEDAETSNVVDFVKAFNVRLAEREKEHGGRSKKAS